jgi:hypothetical protein
MVADPYPLSRVLHNRMQHVVPFCEHGDLSNMGQIVSHSESLIPLLEGKKCSRKLKFADGANFQQNGNTVCTADKTEGKAALSKAVRSERHSPLGS